MNSPTFDVVLKILPVLFLAAVGLSGCDNKIADPSDARGQSTYQVSNIKNPSPGGNLIDLQHHFHIDLKDSRDPIKVEIPLIVKYFRDVDIDTLHLVRYGGEKEGYELIGPLDWSDSGVAFIDVKKTGNYSVVGLPSTALGRSIIRAYCPRKVVPKICTQIYCPSLEFSSQVAYMPGVPVCELCDSIKPGISYSECLIDFKAEVLYPPLKFFNQRDDSDTTAPVCEYKRVSGCYFRPQAANAQECRDLAAQFNEFYEEEISGRSCVCGTSARATFWAPPPNACFPGQSCIGFNYNCEAVPS
jgi:hypothetical protein